MPKQRRRHRISIRRHSLSLVAIALLALWITGYCFLDPKTHLGAFFGNAIADWTGLVVTVLATKFMYEKGSAESRKPPHRLLVPIWEILQEHSLSIFLIITGAAWIWAFARAEPNSKWGQVVGNIVSEWTQIFGLVILTKKLIETHSKESR